MHDNILNCKLYLCPGQTKMHGAYPVLCAVASPLLKGRRSQDGGGGFNTDNTILFNFKYFLYY